MAEINQDEVLKDVKLDLAISDELQDNLLKMLLGKVVAHFQLEYSVESVDASFAFIMHECVIKRFNRRGSEGAKSESVEGHSVSYSDYENEFEPYDDLIRKKLNLLETKERSGRLYIL